MDRQNASEDPARAVAVDPAGNDCGQTRPLTILVVDDEPNICRLIRNFAEKAGHRVFTVANGAEAWDLLNQRDDVDVVISDVMMPEMGGHELMRLIDGNPKTANLPFLMIGARAPDDVSIQIRFRWDSRLPVRWFMSKPFSPTFLVNVIAKITRPEDPAVNVLEDWHLYFKDNALHFN